MDKKGLQETAEKIIQQAHEMTKKTARAISKKAGEAAHITKLLVEKITIEHRISQKMARLGSRVYAKVLSDGKDPLPLDPEIRGLVEQTQDLERELSRVQEGLASARRREVSKK